MGAGYSGYAKKTGVVQGELPENLAKMEFEDIHAIETMEEAEERIVSEMNQKIGATDQSVENLKYDLDRIRTQIAKRKSLIREKSSMLRFFPISEDSTLHRDNKKLLPFEKEPVLLFEYKKKNKMGKNDKEEGLLFEYIPRISTLSRDNKILIQFETE